MWPVLVDQVLLGAGFGLLSTPMLVGVQATVTWHDRGVVTGANIFSRYLGESLGAAICGAIFNSTIRGELAHAPPALRARLPHGINAVIGALQRHEVHGAPDEYLRRAIYAGTHHVYAGLVIVALITVAVVLFTPRRFPVAGEAADAMAAGAGADGVPAPVQTL